MKISRETRRNILDWLAVERTEWSGRLSEEAFLDRVVDLDTLPSTDSRFSSARGDIRQHRSDNDDSPRWSIRSSGQTPRLRVSWLKSSTTSFVAIRSGSSGSR
jgi:AbiJ N-terminal domain 3